MDKPIITQERLKSLLHYSPETGVFVWNRRPRSMFKSERQQMLFNSRREGTEAGHKTNYGYISIRIDKRPYMAHRLAWLYVYGEWPKFIDHDNRNKSDNRLCNLRNVTHSENMKNRDRQPNSTSGITGVSLIRSTGKWRAHIKHHGKWESLGNYQTIEEAAEARKAAEIKYGFHPNHGS